MGVPRKAMLSRPSHNFRQEVLNYLFCVVGLFIRQGLNIIFNHYSYLKVDPRHY